MKARVPKNKNNTGKSIVHFSREIGDEYPTKNPLETLGPVGNTSRKSTFDLCMDGWGDSKPKEEYKFK